MLAQRFAGLLPALTHDEALESAAVLSLTGAFSQARWAERTFRAPHHTASPVALVGGGSPPRPGEISLSHHGVLFLDELPEFPRAALEGLREPLETGRIVISRAARQAEFPARFQLIAAMNPCPCGHQGSPLRACRCTPDVVARYQGRISGPLLDRIDIHIDAPALSLSELRSEKAGETSAAIRGRAHEARARQQARFAGTRVTSNARMTHAQIRRHCPIDSMLGDLLQQAMEQLSLSARAYDRILKVARTIADLAGRERIEAPHLLEAIQYRSLDRTLFY
jgi:magnesium chelatase family protein